MTDVSTRNRVSKGVTTGGQFATETKPETPSVALTGAESCYTARYSGVPIAQDKPLSHYEMGLRTPPEGPTTLRIATELGEYQPGSEAELDTAMDLLPAMSYPSGIQGEPVSVVDGKVIVDMHIDELDLDGLSDAEFAEFTRGQADRPKWLSRGHATYEQVDSEVFFEETDSELLGHVPPLPGCVPDDVEIEVYYRSGGYHLVELNQKGQRVAMLRYTPASDESSDSHDEMIWGDGPGEEVPDWASDEDDQYEIQAVLQVVAENHDTIQELAMSRTKYTHGFQSRAAQLALAGNPDPGY